MKIYKIKVNGKVYEVEVESVTESKAKITEEITAKPLTNQASGQSVNSPMQGTILKSHAQKGKTVKKGSVLFILEAMKLENEILAPADGIIQDILVSVGQKVDVNQTLLIIG